MLPLTAVLVAAALQGTPCGTAPAAPAAQQVKALRNNAELIALMKLPDGSTAPASLKIPSLANAPAIGKYMREHYPADLRTDSTKYDMAIAWVCVDTTGAVVGPSLIGYTGSNALDTLALKLVQMATFTPATVDAKKIAVWLPVPVQVSPMGIMGDAKPTTKDLSKAPVYTPFNTGPELMNGRDVAQEMLRSYPPRLRASGMGGVTVMWVFVDEKGAVKNAVVKQTSGNRELDDLALALTSIMRFNPALYNDQKVPVWITLPFRLRAN